MLLKRLFSKIWKLIVTWLVNYCDLNLFYVNGFWQVVKKIGIYLRNWSLGCFMYCVHKHFWSYWQIVKQLWLWFSSVNHHLDLGVSYSGCMNFLIACKNFDWQLHCFMSFWETVVFGGDWREWDWELWDVKWDLVLRFVLLCLFARNLEMGLEIWEKNVNWSVIESWEGNNKLGVCKGKNHPTYIWSYNGCEWQSRHIVLIGVCWPSYIWKFYENFPFKIWYFEILYCKFG